MRTFEVPGLPDPVALSQLITAAAALVGGPLIGWLLQRLINSALGRRAAYASWRWRPLVSRGIRSSLIVGLTLTGAFIAVAALPMRGGVRTNVEKGLIAVLIISITWIIAGLATDAVKLAARRTEQERRSSSIFINLTRLGIAILGVLFLLQNLGVSITPMLTALGIGGLAVALAMQDTLTNLFAGIQLIATKKVKRGDYIRLDTGDEGYVADIDWRHTSIRQLPSNMVLVPNSKLAASVITNFHYPNTEMSILIQVGVSYASDLEKVESVTIDVARQTLREVPGGVSWFEPFVRFHTFNDFSIDFTVIIRVHEFTDQYLVKHEFVKRLHRRYEEEGIEIPFPIRTLKWDENARGDGRDGERSVSHRPTTH